MISAVTKGALLPGLLRSPILVSSSRLRHPENTKERLSSKQAKAAWFILPESPLHKYTLDGFRVFSALFVSPHRRFVGGFEPVNAFVVVYIASTLNCCRMA